MTYSENCVYDLDEPLVWKKISNMQISLFGIDSLDDEVIVCIWCTIFLKCFWWVFCILKFVRLYIFFIFCFCLCNSVKWYIIWCFGDELCVTGSGWTISSNWIELCEQWLCFVVQKCTTRVAIAVANRVLLFVEFWFCLLVAFT